MHYGLPGSFFHGVIQARILEFVALPFSRVSSRSRERTQLYVLYIQLVKNKTEQRNLNITLNETLNYVMQINELEEMGIWVVWNTLESFS